MNPDWYLGGPALREFSVVRAGAAVALVRRDYEPFGRLLGLAGDLLRPDAAAHSAIGIRSLAEIRGGRVGHPLITLEDGTRAVVRRYHRGGAIRMLFRDRYFLGDRAFAEARITEIARQAGVRAPEVLAATQRPSRFGYCAWLATRFIHGAVEAAAFLATAAADARDAMLGETGRQIGLMHHAGIAHPDLNLRNLLVASGPEGRRDSAPEIAVYIIDFDRARHRVSGVGARRRAADLRRMARSARKLRVELTTADWEVLRAGYARAG